ncbi:MAG: D-2-hydroxyacid dehydrogenase [Opitutus sp.]|nr:D-2-hydroxyacid dehydrogenase [Opitutus sp.]
MTKIVVLDSLPLNPGDLSWDEMIVLGDCTLHARAPVSEIVARCEAADIVLTNKVPLSAATLGQLPQLRYIGVMVTGYNIVDTAAASARGVVVTNVPAYGTRSVAQHTMALLLELTNRVGGHAAGVRQGEWCRSPDWSYWSGPLVELEGLTLGIVGRGRIGGAVAQIAEALGMRTISGSSRGGPEELLRLFEASDVISLHCPLTPATHRLINRDTLAHCKPTALLVNTARGALVHEADLADALNSGRLAGAALDVLSTEPPSPANPLLLAKNCLITPHVAWATSAARARLLNAVVGNVRAFLAGAPKNVVS